jgi:DNA-binding NarL/FixJ family response regulator
MAAPDRAVSVAVVGGGALAAEGLALMLEEAGRRRAGHYPTLEALGRSAAGLAEAPAIALLDTEDESVELPAIPALRSSRPSLRFVLLCGPLTPDLVAHATTAGVDGVVLKTDSPEGLEVAIRHALEGRAVMPTGWGVAGLPEPILSGLSERERQVLELAASGLTNPEIAARLMISKSTVKFHLHSVYAQLGVRNRLEAVLALRGTRGASEPTGAAAPRSRAPVPA